MDKDFSEGRWDSPNGHMEGKQKEGLGTALAAFLQEMAGCVYPCWLHT